MERVLRLDLRGRRLGLSDVEALRDEAVVDYVEAGHYLKRVWFSWLILVGLGSIVLFVDWRVDGLRLDAISIAFLLAWIVDTIVLVRAIHHHAICADNLGRVDQLRRLTRRDRTSA